ncbi:PWWP domain-containing DNA repair factor 3A [Lissotriton helveticus]
MSPPGHVLCAWKGRLWPATVLTKIGAPRKKDALHDPSEVLEVELLGGKEQISVPRRDIFPLEKAKIEALASELDERSKQPVEEITYRKALRIALENLNKNSKRPRSSLDKETSPTFAPNVRKAKLSRAVALNGSATDPIGKAVRADTSSDGTSERQRSPNLSSSSTKASVKLKGKAPVMGESKASSKKASDARREDPSSTPKSRKPDLKVAKERKASTISSDSTPSSPGDEKKPKTPKKCPRNSLQLDGLATGTHSVSLENVPVSGFRHSIPPTLLKKGSCTSSHTRQKSGNLYANDNSFQETDRHALIEAQNSSSMDCVTDNLGKSRVTCKQGLEQNRCQSCPDPFSSSISQTKSSRETRRSGSYALCKPTTYQLPDFEVDEKDVMSSDLSVEFSSPECPSHTSSWVQGEAEDDDDDEELPSILLQQEPCSIETGMLVWCKYYKYPYWPGVVNYVRRKDKKASVLFVEESLADPTKKAKKGVSVSLRTLKHFDCEEKQDLTEKARSEYGRAIDWCIALISDYRIRLGCGSFSGSFTEYCAAEISYPVRREVQKGPFQLTFPSLETDTDDSQTELTPSRSHLNRKCLPDRTRAARDKANEKLVEYIVKAKKAEKHLLSVLKGERQSRWLHEFLHPCRYLTCVETYLEDEEQLELVVDYLQTMCDQMSSLVKTLMNGGDLIRFILDVLLPEAVIYAISAVDKIDYKKAEEKYMKGPSVSQREREIFEEQILEKKMLELQDSAARAMGTSAGHFPS